MSLAPALRRLAALGALLVLSSVAAACANTPLDEILAGKACDGDGSCADGYVCDTSSMTCVPEGTPIATGGGGTGGEGTGGDETGGAGGTGGTGGGEGGSGGCTSVAECPAAPGPCETPICLGGQCGTSAKPMGELVVPQTPGNCKAEICDGAGNVLEQNDDTDLPVDGVDCTGDLCNSGVTDNPPLRLGAPCDDGGGTQCDGNGACVECLVASDCTMLPPSDECQLRDCAMGVCIQVFTQAGTALVDQQVGDCHELQCDGSGGVSNAIEDSDLPDDDNDCTDDVCMGGIEDHPPFSDTTSCAAGTCDGFGNCVGCMVPEDCSGMDTFCQQRTCNNGVCGTNLTAAGTVLPSAQQTTGDCKQAQCDGTGGVTQVVLASDTPPDDGTACTDQICSMSTPQFPPTPLNSSCTDGGGMVCDGAGTCVQCNTASQCSNQGGACETASCTGNTCGLAPLANGTPAKSGAQTSGDCKIVICNGSGGSTVQNDNGDLPVDGNDCTADVCTMGVPSNPPHTAGTPCGTNGTCNGAGMCTGGNKPLGDPCTAGSECASTHCVDGVCCNSACSGACQACSAAKNGATSGTCSGVPAGQDPDGECTSPDTCDVNGVCSFTCGQDPTPVGGSCPAVCTGGCITKTCIIDCNAPGACQNQTLDCPPGFACEVQCGDAMSCASATIECPDLYACSVICSDGCDNAVVSCGTGVCDLSCAGGNVCSGTELLCGTNDCAASCNGGAFPTVTCSGNCLCESCEFDNGESCTSPSQCLSGFCPADDDVCCDAACDQTCAACLAAKSGGVTGICDDVATDTDPDQECTGAQTCDGAGACGLKQNGDSCNQGAECQSGFCPTQDGVCCESACSGTCNSCLGANTPGSDGQCLPIVSGADPNNECAGASTCNGSGACSALPNGAPCNNNNDCMSGNCPPLDKVCCNTACSGLCQACTISKTGQTSGTCGAVNAGTDPDNECQGMQVCNASSTCQ